MVACAACEKEAQQEVEQQPEQPSARTVLQVGIADTKTYLGDSNAGARKVYWSNGDQIRVNGTASDALAGLADNTASADFTFTGDLSTPYNVLYPASIYTDATHVTLPAVQTYKEGGIADNMLPLAGYSSTGDNLSLSHLCAMVKISVLRKSEDPVDTDNIVSVRFKGRNSEKVSGSFEIAYNPAALTETTGTGDDLEVRVVKNQATSTNDAIVYYLVVPARTYSNGFDVIVQDVKGDIMTKSKASSIDLVAGKLYNLAEFAFVPNGTATGIEITSADDLIAFATAYNNKEYGDDLVATITADITFDATTSADFNATGGIGTSGAENRFSGIFNGNNRTISGLVSTVPFFGGTASSSIIKDLTLDNSCSFTFTHPNTEDAFVGSMVGYHRGALDNVSVAADVTISDGDIDYATALGGLVGRIVVGSIKDCSYSGAISVPANFSAADKKIYIGGLVGWISNEAGTIQNSTFNGTLENEGKMVASSETDEMKNNPQLIIGGIVGLNAGVVSSCEVANHATGVTVILNDGSDHPYTGTIVTHSTNAYHYAVGGIVGRNDKTVSGCTNNAEIVNIFSAERGTGGNMNGRYLEVGGIVGYNDSGATISGSDNNGPIIDRANPKIHYVGGIVGRNIGLISSSDNSATGTIAVGTSHLTPYGARMLYAGGIIGSNENGASLSNIHNAAAINVSRIESATGFICRIGGVAGYSAAAIDGATGGGTITNTGNIAQSTGIGHCTTPAGANDYGYHVGGIVGNSTKAVKNVSNSGNITFTCNATGVGAQYVRLGGIIGKVDAASTVDIEKCMNTGNVTYTASASHKDNAATRYYYNYLGGIVGYANNAAIKGDSSTKCTNSGVIRGGDGGDNNNQDAPSFMIGGIVGYITGDSSIEYCDLIGSGNAYNDHWSNRGLNASHDTPSVGGIAGQIVGADGTPIPVSHCNIASTASVNARRGAVGGIVGLAQYAAISDCNMPVIFQTSQSGYFYGGIVAAVINSTVSNCVFSGATIRSSQLQIAGGIVGQLDANSTIDGCSSSATDVSKNGTAVTTTGGIAGKSVAGSTIQNCHYTATIVKICGDSNFSDGGGNVADL